MPFPPRRRGSRLIGGILGMATAVSLVGLAAPSYADDDYPYRGLGQCPLVPLPPHAHTKPGKPDKPVEARQALEARAAHHVEPARLDRHPQRSEPNAPGSAARLCQAHLVLQRHLRRPVGLRAAQLHELRGLAAAEHQRVHRLLELPRRRRLRQRRPVGRQRGGARLPRRRHPGRRRRRPDRRRSGRARRLGLRGRCRHRHRRGVQLLRRRRLRHPHRADLGLPLPAPRRRLP